MLDTSVFIRAERGLAVDFSRWQALGEAFISVLTVSELLVGVHRAHSEARRVQRLSYVEAVIQRFPALVLTADVARVHAEVMALLMEQGQQIGAHDLLIAATALTHGHAVLTSDIEDFSRVPGLTVIPLN